MYMILQDCMIDYIKITIIINIVTCSKIYIINNVVCEK